MSIESPAPASLPRRPLGGTGLEVTPIGLGLAALGRPAYITLGRQRDLGEDRRVPSMERRTHRMLDAAYGHGVRYVDAARSYGEAEAFLGRWLRARSLRPGAVTVGSKWGYRYTGGWRLDAPQQEVKDHSLAMLEHQWPETESNLGEYLCLYQVHSATLESGVLDDSDVLRALAALRRRGVRAGLSVSGPAQGAVVRRALEVTVDGSNPFQTVQATFNVLEPSAGPALAEAHAAGWGVLVKEAFANGRLTAAAADRPGAGPRNGAEGRPRAVLRSIGERHGAGPDQVALAAVLAQPWVDVVLSGAVTEGQLEGDVAALAVVLGEEDLSRLAALVETPAAYWDLRSRLPWR